MSDEPRAIDVPDATAPRPAEMAIATAELRRRLGEIQETVRRLEESKTVSRETMNLEITV